MTKQEEVIAMRYLSKYSNRFDLISSMSSDGKFCVLDKELNQVAAYWEAGDGLSTILNRIDDYLSDIASNKRNEVINNILN